MKDLQFPRSFSCFGVAAIVAQKWRLGNVPVATFALAVPSRNDPDWKPWSWMIPSYW